MRRLLLLMCLLIGLVAVVTPSPPAQAADAVTLQNAVAATANGNTLAVEGFPSAIIEITALTGTATVAIESSITGTLWQAQTCYLLDGITSASTYSATALVRCNTVGVKFLRARVSVYVSGAITVFGAATPLALSGGSGGGGSGSTLPCVATAAAPSYVEGATVACSTTLAGNTRSAVNEFNVLLSGEDQTNSLLMTSGGKVRTVVWPVISTNTTSTVQVMHTGAKTVKGTLVCNAGGSTNCGITMTVYGNENNSTTGGEQLCQVIIPTGAATTPGTCPPITQPFSYFYITTTGVAGTSPVLTVTGMF